MGFSVDMQSLDVPFSHLLLQANPDACRPATREWALDPPRGLLGKTGRSGHLLSKACFTYQCRPWSRCTIMCTLPCGLKTATSVWARYPQAYFTTKDTGALYEEVRPQPPSLSFPRHMSLSPPLTLSVVFSGAGCGEPHVEPDGHDGHGQGPGLLRPHTDGHDAVLRDVLLRIRPQ